MQDAEERIEVSPIASLKDNYIWVIQHQPSSSALIIDPGDAKPVIDWLTKKQLRLAGILITHHHGDHTQGITGLIKNNSVPVIGPATESIPHLTQTCKPEEVISIGSFPAFAVIAIPGHTKGHVAYYTPGYLFCGDTLFAGGCGRLFEGTAAELYHSLQRLSQLPASTKVYCAHEYTLNNLNFAKTIEPHNQALLARLDKVQKLRAKHEVTLPSTIAEEKATNPFLRCDQASVRKTMTDITNQDLPSPLDVFAALRAHKDTFSI